MIKIKNSRSLFLIILFLIILIATVLRVYKLGNKGIWHDEASSIAMSQADFSISTLLNVLNYKPLYFLSLKLWSVIFGISAFWLRLLSVIFAIISLLLVYLIGKEISGRKVGMISSFLLAISCFHIYHSQQVRQFTLMFLLITLSYLCLIRLIKYNKIKYYMLNTVSNILLMFTHPYGLAIIISENIYLFFIKKESGYLRKKYFFCQLFTLVFFLLWLLLSSYRPYMLHNVWWIEKPDLNTILDIFQTFSYGGPRYGLDDFRISFKYGIINIISFFLYNVFFIKGLFNKVSANYNWKSLLCFWFFVPIVVAYSVSFFIPVLSIKHLFIVLPAYYIIVAIGICNLKRKSVAILALLLFLLGAYPLKIMYSEDNNVHWREAVNYLRNNIRKDDAIVISNQDELPAFLYYFCEQPKTCFKNMNPNIPGKIINKEISEIFYENSNLIIGIKQNRGEGSDFVKQDFDRKFKYLQSDFNFTNAWFILTRWTEEPESKYMEEAFNKKFVMKKMQSLEGTSIYKINLSK